MGLLFKRTKQKPSHDSAVAVEESVCTVVEMSDVNEEVAKEANQPPPPPKNMTNIVRRYMLEDITTTIKFDKCDETKEYMMDKQNDLDMPLEMTASESVIFECDEENSIYTSIVTVNALSLYSVLSLSCIRQQI